LAADDRMLGLRLEQLAVDSCITKAPWGGQAAGASPVDRRKQGLKRSVAVEAGGILLAAVPVPANRRDDGLLAVTLDAIEVVGSLPAQPVVHLDAGYDDRPCGQVLAARGMAGQVATRGLAAPIQASRRWVIERSHAWGNQDGRLRWCTERRRIVVALWWRWPTRLSRWVGSFAKPGPATAGRAARDAPVIGRSTGQVYSCFLT
jgi:hypothetical protein